MSSEKLFQTAVSLLKQYEFYPKDIVSVFGDHNVYRRQIEVGDRIVHRVHVFQLRGWHILDAIAMTEVVNVINEPRSYGITYATVDTHVEQGEWTAIVKWKNNNDVVLEINSLSRPVPHEPTRNYNFYAKSTKTSPAQRVSTFCKPGKRRKNEGCSRLTISNFPCVPLYIN